MLLESIKNLTVKNFQVHELFSIDFDPQVTTIIGPSDVGKSSILRALRWVALNDLAGESFIRWGSKKAHVQIQLDDGTLIVREKGGSVNRYAVDEKEFVAFGTRVPPDVEDELRLSEASFQGQYDRPFWLGETAGFVSKELNKVADLDVIDRSLSVVASIVKRAGTACSIVSERVEQAEQKLEEWKSAPAMERDYLILRERQEAVEDVIREIAALSYLIGHGNEALKTFRQFRDAALEGKKILDVGESWVEQQRQMGLLFDLTMELDGFEEALSVQVPTGLEKIEEAGYYLVEKFAIQGVFLKFLNDCTSLVDSEEETQSDLDEASSQFTELLGKECPLCQSVLS